MGWCDSTVSNRRMHLAVSSLRGKLGGLYACGATFRYIVPLPNIFLTRLFSKLRLKRKDFQEILRLPWAQEVPSSNLGAPTTYFFIINELSLKLQRWRPNLGPAWVQIQASPRFNCATLFFGYRMQVNLARD